MCFGGQAVYIRETSTDTVANTSATAASSGSDLNGSRISWREFKGQLNRGNRTGASFERVLGGRVFRGVAFRDFSELQRFFRGFQRSSQRPPQRQISLSEALGRVGPNRVAP